MSTPKYPQVKVTVNLNSSEGNIYEILVKCVRAMQRRPTHEIPVAEIESFRNEFFSAGSYEQALEICKKWVALKLVNSKDYEILTPPVDDWKLL